MAAEIGRDLGQSPGSAVVATVVAAAIVVGDVVLVWYDHEYSLTRLLLPAVGLATLVLLGARREGLGLRLVPAGGWRRWAKTGLVLGMAVLAAAVAVPVADIVRGRPVDLPCLSPGQSGQGLWQWCVVSPVIEGSTYRLVLCAALASWLRPTGTAIVSGLAFTVLQIASGFAGPAGIVGGFLLAWAFQESGSILVPLALHVLGSLAYLIFCLANGCVGR